MWLACIPMVLFWDHGRRVFWTCLVALVPVLWVVGGYHFWRAVCPLGFFATLAQRFGWEGKRKLGGSWLTRGLLFNLAVMFLALCARLLALNGERLALAGFILGVSLLAAALGFLFKGKTWCNFLCPVGLVEKLYTEPLPRPGSPTSRCAACSGCRKACPDIDLEQHYWKEAEQPQRRHAAYAWPGLVLAFYASYWFETGDWQAYFGGSWTLDDGQLADALGPGLFFLPAVPRLVATPLLLLASAALSWGLFRGLERFIGEAHKTRMLAGSSAFLLFYLFAGQPTIRLAPEWVGLLWWTALLVLATWMLQRRWLRTEPDFVREKFARRLLQRWKWSDDAQEHRLEDLVVLDAERKRQRDERLAAYEETLRSLGREGLLTHERLATLGGLRAQLNISEAEHRKIVERLEAGEPELFAGEEQDEGAADLAALTAEDAAALVGLEALAPRLEGEGSLKDFARLPLEEERARLRARLLSVLQALDRPADQLDGLLPASAAPRPAGLLERALRRLEGAPDAELDDLVALRELALLRGLSSADLVRVLELAQGRRFEAGERLCEVGQVEDRVYVLRSGEVEVELSSGARRLGPGACIGELAVLDPAPRSATVRALGPVEALVLEGEDFRHLGTTRPSLSEGLLRSLARRLREMG